MKRDVLVTNAYLIHARVAGRDYLLSSTKQTRIEIVLPDLRPITLILIWRYWRGVLGVLRLSYAAFRSHVNLEILMGNEGLGVKASSRKFRCMRETRFPTGIVMNEESLRRAGSQTSGRKLNASSLFTPKKLPVRDHEFDLRCLITAYGYGFFPSPCFAKDGALNLGHPSSSANALGIHNDTHAQQAATQDNC